MVITMKKIIFIFIFTILLTGCKYNMYEIPDDVKIKTINKSYEVYSKNNMLYDLILEKNVEILTKNKELNTKKLGENNVTIKIKYKKRTYKYKIKYNVVDTTKPIYLSVNTNKTILVNEKIDFCNNIVTADNYDKKVTCKTDGEFDNTKIGQYKMKYIISDSSNNTNELDYTVNVIESYPKSNSSKSNQSKNNISFNEIIDKYKNENTMIGIDVSRWQEDIDFEKVKDAGCEFVIMRIAINSDTDKDISTDTYFNKNIKNAKKAGLKVGVYVYTTAINDKIAKSHAKYVIKELNKTKLDFPIAFDWENWSKFDKYNISMYNLTSAYLAFDKEIKKHGYTSMLYSSKYYLENIWMYNDEYPVWLAHYIDETGYKGNYIMWQMTNIGEIDGIEGDVDIDIYYKNK